MGTSRRDSYRAKRRSPNAWPPKRAGDCQPCPTVPSRSPDIYRRIQRVIPAPIPRTRKDSRRRSAARRTSCSPASASPSSVYAESGSARAATLCPLPLHSRRPQRLSTAICCDHPSSFRALKTQWIRFKSACRGQSRRSTSRQPLPQPSSFDMRPSETANRMYPLSFHPS